MKSKITLITTLILLFCANVKAQWVTKIVNNGIDEPYKIAYCYSSDRTAVLKLERVGDEVAFYITGGYHCDDFLSVDMGLDIDGEINRWSFDSYTSSDNESVFIIDNLLDPKMSDFITQFKKCDKISVRINESHCEDDYYKFNMSGSTKALEFISK